MSEAQLVAIGSAIGEATRAAMLTVLVDGRAYTSGELARLVDVSPSTASEHLGKLLDVGMVRVEAQGRHRYFQLAGPEVAELLERLGVAPDVATPPMPRAPADLTYARCCYDHLAGTLAVRLLDGLQSRGAVAGDDHHLEMTASGLTLLGELGVDLDALQGSRRPVTRACLDWTERRHHLAGAAGAALLTVFLARGWMVRGNRPRALRVTRAGKIELERLVGCGV